MKGRTTADNGIENKDDGARDAAKSEETEWILYDVQYRDA